MANFLSDPGFMPHVHCYIGKTSLIWTMVITDLLIGLSYIAISLTLWALIRKTKIRFSFVVACFGLFIAACGATHFMEVWTLWNPDYWVSASVKIITAIASVGTAIYFFRLRHWLTDLSQAAMDLEHKVQAEVRKRESERQLFQADLYDILERTTDGFFMVDAQWRMTYANPVTQQFFAIAGRSLIGKTMVELFPSPDRPKFMRHYEEIARSGNPDRFEETYEGRILQVHAYKMRDGGVAIFYRDVTDQKQANDNLIESEKRYATLTSSLPQLVWTCLNDGRCNYLSKQWEDYTGISADQQMDYNWLNRVIHPEDQERTLKHWLGAVAGLNPYDIQYRIRRFDGGYRWFQTRGTPMKDDLGQIKYWVGTCTDIQSQKILATELNEAKLTAEKSNEAKTQFLANMSHEIRTPIGAITGFAEMLNKPDHTDLDKQRFAAIIEKNSKHLLRLIDDILDLSKVEVGKIVFEQANFSLPDFFHDLAALMSLKASEKGIAFHLHIDQLIPSEVVGDQLRLKQILVNIVGNALKFTEKGQVIIKVTSRDDLFKISVTDTGIGIPSEQIDKLFKPFSQADPSFTRKFGGTGLGLILSKHLANHLGGDLILKESEPGRGSVFIITVRLPSTSGSQFIRYSPGLVTDTQNVPRPEAVALLAGVNILLVEDSPDNQMLISTYLNAAGASVTLAHDGQEGYDKALEIIPDIILMDIQMPRLDGHQATKMLRSAGFAKPIIALTAHAMLEEKKRCFESGCSDYLTKPLSRKLLIEVISKNFRLSADREWDL